MKKLLLLACFVSMMVVGVQARTITASWTSWEGADAPEWDCYGDYTAVSSADYKTSDPDLGDFVADAYVFHSDINGNVYSVGNEPFVYDEYQGRTGLLELTDDGQLVFELDNYIGGDFKEMYVEVTYLYEGADSVVSAVAQSQGSELQSNELVNQIWDGDWVTDVWQLVYAPNPCWEAVAIDFETWSGDVAYPVLIDDVVISTECVPEPATLVLLALGSFLGFNRRK